MNSGLMKVNQIWVLKSLVINMVLLEQYSNILEKLDSFCQFVI